MAERQIIDRMLALGEDVLSNIESDIERGLSCTRTICTRVISVSDLMEAVSSFSVDEPLAADHARRFNAIETRQIAILQKEGEIRKRNNDQKETGRKRTKTEQ